jgi:crotonobetainyl-CoA:carnitine CoA-transferase CaiB-like acyl-CoA transferase
MDRAQWPAAKEVLAARFREHTRDEWARRFGETDVCLAPVLDFDEASSHPHIKARGTFIDLDGVTHPAPGPRFSRTPAAPPEPPVASSTDNAIDALRGWLADDRIEALRARDTFI